MRPLLSLALTVIASPALAQDTATQGWVSLPLAQSADLAAWGWRQVGAAAVSGWGLTEDDMLITFWEGELNGARVTLRCTEIRIDGEVVDVCEQPVADPLRESLFAGASQP